MNYNQELLDIIKQSFEFVTQNPNNNRSSAKVDIIHWVFTKHLQEQLGNKYIVKTKLTTGKEEVVQGRYYNKRVDVAIKRASDNQIVAAVGFKFVLSSFTKNSNNYFENMLGETANIRSNNIPYFQVIILLKNLPNFSSNGKIISFLQIDDKHLQKYQILSQDNMTSFYHTPLKTLILVVNDNVENQYLLLNNKTDYYKSFNSEFNYSIYDKLTIKFNSGIVLNDYSKFLEKVSLLIKGFD